MMLKNWLIQIYLRRVKGINLPRDLIRCAVKRNCNKIAVVDGETEISYGELYERAKRLANAFLGLGLAKGNKLAILIYNCQEYFELRIATYLTGIVLVPLIWDSNLEDIVFILNDCEVKIFIYHPEILKNSIETIKEKTQVENFVSISNTKDKGSYEDLLQCPAYPSETKLKADDLASINFSSGTTGRPKGIMLTQANWSGSFYNYLLNSDISALKEPVVLHTIPFATAGSTAILPCLLSGAKSIILNKFSAEKAALLIERHRVTKLFLTPSWFISLLEFCKRKAVKLTSLKGITVGTAPLAVERLKEGIDFFGPIIEIGYGMAETLPPIALLHSAQYKRGGGLNETRLSSVGKPVKGVILRIIDEEGKQLPGGRMGRIALKSATRSQGYWHNPELTQRHYKDEFFYSDDFGYVDKEGYLYILGRREDIIELKPHVSRITYHVTRNRYQAAGRSNSIVFAREIEEALHKHPGVLEAFVFGIDKTKIAACVSLRTGSKNVSSEELLKFCADKLEKDRVPGVITILPAELPKNASGKIDRKKVIRDYLRLSEVT